MSAVGIAEVLQRLVELEQDAVSPSKAFPGALITYASYPYWTNVAALEAVRVLSTGDIEYGWRVTAQLHINKLTAGFDHYVDLQADGYLETVAAYFVARPLLNRPDQQPLDNLSPAGMTVSSGRTVVFAAASDINELICEWELRIPIRKTVGVK